MCTALCLTAGDHYFGRTLDLEFHYTETVTVTPRRLPIPLLRGEPLTEHAAFIGIATVVQGFPLYYDAVNECGLGMAALHFPDNAVYRPPSARKRNVAPFELIPWILAQCETVADALKLLKETNLTNRPFHKDYPLTPLHWLLADRDRAVAVEPTAEGLKLHNNPFGVLTNNPPFPYHRLRMADFLGLSAAPPENRISKNLPLSPYSRGLGGMGLPGDFSSSSRFVRAVFAKENSLCGDSEESRVGQFFHLLGTVTQPRGCVKVGDAFVETVYTSCCNVDRGIYYYTTYGNRQISAVDLHREDLGGSRLISYPLIAKEQIRKQN